nr:hypothetical protein [Aeromonas sp. 1HA1]
MMTRPSITVFLALSLDGFIAGEANSLDWLTPYASDPPESYGDFWCMGEIEKVAYPAD